MRTLRRTLRQFLRCVIGAHNYTGWFHVAFITSGPAPGATVGQAQIRFCHKCGKTIGRCIEFD